jgi:hypothetical protein
MAKFCANKFSCFDDMSLIFMLVCGLVLKYFENVLQTLNLKIDELWRKDHDLKELSICMSTIYNLLNEFNQIFGLQLSISIIHTVSVITVKVRTKFVSSVSSIFFKKLTFSDILHSRFNARVDGFRTKP